jgi:arylsulfatase A-like enzyme
MFLTLGNIWNYRYNETTSAAIKGADPMDTLKPNVLIICVDHWPGLLLGAAGHPVIQTPTLDTLAESGIRFAQAYSETPTCIPARRALMTGTRARTHGDRSFNETLPMDPALPTLPQVFAEAGYQTFAVGKLHVYPQRSRIGFDDVILNEEGRHHLGLSKDDYEIYLADQGYNGQEQIHGMGVNEYTVRPWHLPEQMHPTWWITRNMCRTIQRRDPTRPSLWFCSYTAPHPPITPPQVYLDIYRDSGVDSVVIGSWAEEFEKLPWALKHHRFSKPSPGSAAAIERARMGFYAQCTYIDHQLRLVIGTLREEGVLDNTIILVTGDHGDMLGNHTLWAKPPMFEQVVKIPFILVDTADYRRADHHRVDERFCGLEDVMPTLLQMCDLPIPPSVEGRSLLSEGKRDHYYCEHYEDERAMRMVRWQEYKLIYYPLGNRFQLFNLKNDPQESTDLSDRPELRSVLGDGLELLGSELYGSDLEWIHEGKLVGWPDKIFEKPANRGLSAQRGWRL